MNTLTNEDWTFPDISTQQVSHGFHPYPARMHPEIAKRLIEKYSNPGDLILDPFMGSGGVLVEAILQNRNTVGIDLNPFACFISKVKTTIVDSQELDKILESLIVNFNLDKNKKITYNNKPTDKDINLDFWFKPKVSNDLSILKHHIFNIQHNDISNFFKLCFSITTRKASNQRNSIYKTYRINKDDLETFNPDVLNIFNQISIKNIKLMKSFSTQFRNNNATSIIINENTKNIVEVFKNNNIPKSNLIVTSPPYGDHQTTVAYGQFSHHPSLWLDIPKEQIKTVDKLSLGGKRNQTTDNLDSNSLKTTLKQVIENDQKYSKNKPTNRHLDVLAFFNDFNICLSKISSILIKNQSYCCFILANRTVRRVKIPTDKITLELCKKYNFKHIDTITRKIPNKAMSTKNAPENLSNSPGETMNDEIILIFSY